MREGQQEHEPVGCYLFVLLLISLILLVTYFYGDWLIEGMDP